MQHHKKVPQGRLSQGLQPQKPPPQKNAPLSAAVESDVVGYTTVESVAKGFSLVGFPFVELQDENNTGYSISSISGSVSANDYDTRADQIMVQNAETKDYVTFFNSASFGWVKIDPVTGTAVPETTTEKIPVGSAVFVNFQNATNNVVITGKVNTQEVIDVPVYDGLNLLVNPYPVSIAIKDIVGTNCSANDYDTRADKIMLLDPATKEYTTYFLSKTYGWVKIDENGNAIPEETVDSIAPAQGFVYQKTPSAAETTIRFSRPF